MSRIKERNYPNRRLTELRKNGLLKIDLSYSHVEAITNKLAHYEDLEEQGRLIELPCKVGDKVWVVVNNELHFWNEDPEYFIAESKFSLPYLEQMGQRIFLTKEEAEAKLKELREGAE